MSFSPVKSDDVELKEKPKELKEKEKKMLTSSQLSDLFRRLDSDGSGELDYGEFRKIADKLGLDIDPQVLSSIFKSVDESKSGTLSLKEFNIAYTKVFLHRATNKSANGKSDEGEFVRAIRYGRNESGYIVEEYQGTTKANDGNFKKTSSRPNTDGTSGVSATKEVMVNMTMETINSLILSDSTANTVSPKKHQIFWWVDIGMKWVGDTPLRQVIDAFDLPNHNIMEDVYGDFGNILNGDPKHRIFLDSGKKETAVLSLFAQALWIKGRPLQYLLPEVLDVNTRGDDWQTVGIIKVCMFLLLP